MNDLSTLMPLVLMLSIIMFMLIGMLACMKAFYRKALPGEVIILSTLEAEPRIIKNGALVLPIIYSASSVSLNTQAVEIDRNIILNINETYDVSLQTIAVQVKDTNEAILKAHKRINVSNNNTVSSGSQIKSIIHHAIQEALLSITDYGEFKNYIASSLDKVGYELVV